MISPSFEGTEARSLSSCVLMLSSVIVAAGFTMWIPSDKVRPVTRPKMLTTPTCPVRTQDVEENATMTSTISRTSMPAPRMKVLPPLPDSIVNGSRMLPPGLLPVSAGVLLDSFRLEAGYTTAVSALFPVT
jgi:hypothetical protein